MRHMRALRPSNLMAIEALADILQSNTNTNTDQQQSYPPPTSSLESEIAHISEATASSSSCSGDGSSGSSSLLPLAAAATPSSIESLSLQHMAKNAGVREASAAEVRLIPYRICRTFHSPMIWLRFTDMYLLGSIVDAFVFYVLSDDCVSLSDSSRLKTRYYSS